MQNSTVMVISPHPDDLEIAMGGTVAKLVNKKCKVISVVVTDGRGSTTTSGLKADDLAKIRKKEVEESSSILGIDELICFDMHDVKTDLNRKEFKKLITENLKKYTPFQVYLPHLQIDKHKTHRTVSEIAIKSFTGFKNASFENTEFWFYEVWTPFPEYDRIEDISDFVSVKKRAINAHKSQLEYKDYTEAILGLNRYRAVFNDVYEYSNNAYAEVFIRYKP